mmetsp:Transcript_8496/g.18322  ORF Transcript_8496/g.18322 Transcript_8496/m.18322 type:complete len:1492 (-) Transcript_8496:1169-5644(-)
MTMNHPNENQHHNGNLIILQPGDQDYGDLLQNATTSAEGRQFWTGTSIQQQQQQQQDVGSQDVGLVRTTQQQLWLLGGPIPTGTALNVTNHDFSAWADSFDVGEMTNMVKQWFQKDFDNHQVTVKILESGQMIHGLDKDQTKLISLSRKTPALLDMAATEDGSTIGQYNNTGGAMGHSGDCNSNIGGVDCLHHELTMLPTQATAVKLYFLAGYSSRPLKAWRDSRVFWIVYDPSQETCWLVPHDLSHAAVGDDVSCTMPLASKRDHNNNNNTLSVVHLSQPVQGTLASASPLQSGGNRSHRDFMNECLATARSIDWTQQLPSDASAISPLSPVWSGTQEKTVTTALAWIPPPDSQTYDKIQTIRRAFDKQIHRWPPHINLLYPFVPEQDFQAAAHLLARALSSQTEFQVTLDEIGHFQHGKSCTAWLHPKETQAFAQLQSLCETAFPHCNDVSSKGPFVPHLTVGQCKNVEAVEELIATATWSPASTLCGELCLICRKGKEDPFEVHWKIALGNPTPIARPATSVDLAISTSPDQEETKKGRNDDTAGSSQPINIDRSIAVFDKCAVPEILQNFAQTIIVDGSRSLATMRGPLKVLASGCCANSRVVLLDAATTSASSEINSVNGLLSGLILVNLTQSDPSIFNKLHQVRWNMARGPRTAVLALTADGCKHICGPMPPVYEDEDEPTPMAGNTISDESVQMLIEFALSTEGDKYFGQLYQPVPSFQDAQQALADWIAKMENKDFASIKEEPDEDAEEPESAFSDADFKRFNEVINVLSVSTATAVERNTLAIKMVKFLRKMSKRTATSEMQTSTALARHQESLELLNGWSGENVDWAIQNKGALKEILKSSNVKFVVDEGVEIDLALQGKIDEAIKKGKSQLKASIRASTTSIVNGWKKMFNAVFQPSLEALMRTIGDNPRYLNYFPEVRNPNMSGVIVRASQSTAKKTVGSNPEEVMKIFHKLGATGFVSFAINFLQTWKTKVVNEICLVDKPGEGFNNPETFAPISHRLEDGPADPKEASNTDVRHMFVLPTFPRLPKPVDEDEDDDSLDEESDEDLYKHMPEPIEEEDLAQYLLMRKEFLLRDPEQGPKQPMWQYVDWLFHQIKEIHQVNEQQAAPLAIRALAFSISRLMNDNPKPEKSMMEIVSSIIHAICFMSARGDPLPHGCIDTFFNMDSTYVPQTKDMERSPWQIEVVNILSRAVDFVRPLMTMHEYSQIRSNFQRAAANVVKRQIVQKLLEDVKEEAKKNAVSQEEYMAKLNSEFYPAYREIVETIRMLLDADPNEFELTNEFRERIKVLHHIVTVDWIGMRRCRDGPVRKFVDALQKFSEKGGPQAMTYLIGRKTYLENLYDMVYHIKYESVDQRLIEELCKIIRAKGRNPDHENHAKWLDRVTKALTDVSEYNARMKGFGHGNQYKNLPVDLMTKMLMNLKQNPAGDDSVTFEDVQSLLAHIHIHVKEPSDLKVPPGDYDGKKSVFQQFRGALKKLSITR